MVKIITSRGEEDRFNSKDIEKDLESAGFPERVAEEIAERIEDKVQDGWSTAQIKEQVNLEIQRLEEDMERARTNFSGSTTMSSERQPMTGERPREKDRVELRA